MWKFTIEYLNTCPVEYSNLYFLIRCHPGYYHEQISYYKPKNKKTKQPTPLRQTLGRTDQNNSSVIGCEEEKQKDANIHVTSVTFVVQHSFSKAYRLSVANTKALLSWEQRKNKNNFKILPYTVTWFYIIIHILTDKCIPGNRLSAEQFRYINNTMTKILVFQWKKQMCPTWNVQLRHYM